MVLSDDHDLAGGQLAAEDTSRLEAVHAGHVDVHEDNIGTKHPRLLKRLDAVAGLAAHMPTGLVLDEIPQSPAKQLMVVGNQDFHDVIQKSFPQRDWMAKNLRRIKERTNRHYATRHMSVNLQRSRIIK